ncbi:MAG: crotonase/enoyl-CoA hydratase family protein [Alphaproteobacteria bacterium]|jgi:enoyl-CoA hydratase|nr:crotonase/enoyl-CoA hydratase family protein [Alphaproteobacteria bacterium]
MAYDSFDFSVTDKIAQIRFNRPDKRNSMTLAFWQEMRAVFAELDSRDDVRVAVISSTGPHFTSGMDLSVFGSLTPPNAEEGRKRENLRRQILWFQECFSVIDQARVPVLAAIQGGCIGGGVDLVTACDMRYCAADAFFTIKEIDIGMVADVGTLQRLPLQMPSGLVRELAYTGRRMPADEAKACGFVNQIFASHEKLVEGVLDIARTIAAKTPLAIAGSKEMLNYARDHSIEDGLNYIATWNAAMLQTADMPEAFAATAQKREAKFDDVVADLPVAKAMKPRS